MNVDRFVFSSLKCNISMQRETSHKIVECQLLKFRSLYDCVCVSQASYS